MTTLEIVLTASLVLSDAALVYFGCALHKSIRATNNDSSERTLNLASFLQIWGADIRDALQRITAEVTSGMSDLNAGQAVLHADRVTSEVTLTNALNDVATTNSEAHRASHEALTAAIQKIDEGHAAGHQALLEAQKPLLDLNKSKAAAAKAQLQGGVYDAATRTIIRGGA